MSNIIILINQDLASDPEINEILRAKGMLHPISIEHSPWCCQRCSADCWIGPKQKLLATLTGLETVCYRCTFKDPEFAAPDEVPVVSLNPDIVDVPRRFT